MKAIKIIYWISTIIVSVMMLFAAYSYLTNDQIKQGFVALGFPGYFRVELAVAKIIGAILLLVPFKSRLKEWVYSGFTIVFISAFIAHIASEQTSAAVMPVVLQIVLMVSYFTYIKSGIYSSNSFRAVNGA